MMYEQDDPKKCTAARMVRMGLASRTRRIPRQTVLLDPFAPDVLLPLHDARSVTAVDCSWRLAEQEFARRFAGARLRLPPLFAGNPVNYAKLGMLTTAEAVCGALFVLGCDRQAHDILSKFRWGHTFYELNRNLLGDYQHLDSEQELDSLLSEYGIGQNTQIIS